MSEHVDTPSGPAGRRARWHETLSKFDLEVKYVPGKSNVVADAMSRYAYPASKALQDCSWHGSLEDKLAMDKIMKEELEEERMVGMILPSRLINQKPMLLVMGQLMPTFVVPRNSLWRENDYPVHMCGPVISESPKLNLEEQKEHQLDPILRKEFLERAKIPKCSVDLFATPQNAQEERYLTEKENAFGEFRPRRNQFGFIPL